MFEDINSYAPDGGNIIPSQRPMKRSSLGPAPNVDRIFREFEREDMLREISKYPVSERKALLKLMRQQYRTRS